MIDRLTDYACKAIQYGLIPFQFPDRYFSIIRNILFNRLLVRELIEISDQRKWYRTWDFKTILDVGGYIGAYAYAVGLFLPDAKIISFEPLAENYQILLKNLSGHPGFRAINKAVGEKSGETAFWKSSFSPSSSVLKMGDLHRKSFPRSSTQVEVTVSMTTLDDMTPLLELEPPVLLKIDVQGYENHVILGAERFLKEVDVIVTEVSYQPLYEGQALFQRINHMLEERGFSYAGSFTRLLSPRDGSILQSDAVFSRARREMH